MNSDTDYFGAIDTIRCTWSGCTFSSSTSTCSFCLHSWYTTCLTLSPMTPLKIQYRYFEQNTIWYLHSYRESDNFLNRWGMMGLLLLVGCTPSCDPHHTQHSLLLFTVQPFYATHCQRQWFYTLRNNWAAKHPWKQAFFHVKTLLSIKSNNQYLCFTKNKL